MAWSTFQRQIFAPILFAAVLLSISIESHATTMAAMTGPLGPGVTYTDSSTPVIVKAAQGGQPNTIVYMPPGSPARGSQFGPYTYEHGFMTGQGSSTPA
ncbi:hypothetical protein QQ73_10675 [Candidatus Endoriftia persephone str. Guaymas]|nr:hypothetical protein [Candidatus Endoriftia persephone str. Guaymas]